MADSLLCDYLGKYTTPVFRPLDCILDFVYPACPSSDLSAEWTDLPVLTLPACPSDSDYSACSLVELFIHWANVQVLTLLWYIEVK